MTVSNETACTLRDSDRQAIRTLWIDDRRDSYPADFLANLFGLEPEEVLQLAGGRTELTEAGEIRRKDALMITATHLYSAAQIEEALGTDAGVILTPGRRTQVVTLRVSAWVVDAIRRAAKSHVDRGHVRDQSLDAIVDDVLQNEAESLGGRVPPFEAV